MANQPAGNRSSIDSALSSMHNTHSDTTKNKNNDILDSFEEQKQNLTVNQNSSLVPINNQTDDTKDQTLHRSDCFISQTEQSNLIKCPLRNLPDSPKRKIIKKKPIKLRFLIDETSTIDTLHHNAKNVKTIFIRILKPNSKYFIYPFWFITIRLRF